MEGTPTILVKKSGFLAAFAKGFFGLLISCVVCATVLGVFALRLVDHKADALTGLAGTVLAQARDWQDYLPPALTDAVHDKRALDLADRVEIETRIITAGREPRLVVAVTNRSDEVITLLALDVALRDGDVPLDAFNIYAATPLAVDQPEWRGPLPPGATREFVRTLGRRYGLHRGDAVVDGREAERLTIAATPVELRIATPRLDVPSQPASVALDAAR